MLDQRRVDSGPTRQLAHNRSEGISARDFSPVDVRSPEHCLTAVYQEPGRRIAVSDDAVGPDAEHPVGHLLVGRDPAPGISPPAELGESCVEASREGGQHDLGIEVSDSLLLRCCHQVPPAWLDLHIIVPYVGFYPQVDRYGEALKAL
jgi:hypothetical protein